MALQELYRVTGLPVFQNRAFRTADEARNCARGDIELVRDMDSGLIFNRAFRPELMTYDADYQNEQALSPTFRRHLDQVAGIVRRQFGVGTLIEVGCGKGYFLEHLRSAGFKIKGIDPAYEGDNPNVIKARFTPQIGLRADGVILRHVLEHMPDPVGFLRDVSTANGGAGKIYIEVPCFDWICARRAWFDIFFEHVNYFREPDFRRLFGMIHESGHVFGGQYLYVVADLATVGTPHLDAPDEFAFPADFLVSIERHAKAIKAGREDGSPDRHAVVWGGASKGVVFSLFMQRAGADVDFVIDINAAKQGKFLPATGIRVLSPDEALALVAPGSTIFVMNSNYLPEIRQATSDKFNYVPVDHEGIRTGS